MGKVDSVELVQGVEISGLEGQGEHARNTNAGCTGPDGEEGGNLYNNSLWSWQNVMSNGWCVVLLMRY